MIGLVSYSAGNQRSVGNALDAIGCAWRVVDRIAALEGCSHLILPGVGHFGPLLQSLREGGWPDALARWIGDGRPFLGICLGMQALYAGSEEAPDVPGLDWLAGRAERYPASVKVPHMGWDEVTPLPGCRLIAEPQSFYFANSYACPHEGAAAICDHGVPFAAAVEQSNWAGVQFHPEKSGQAGLDLLRRFAQW